jgi:misacylated tRNA(Ala) deacylase
MTTDLIFAEDAYVRSCEARVTQASPGAIQLDRTVFYFTSGGQPGDCGVLRLADGSEIAVLDTVKDRESGDILHLTAEDAPLPEHGTEVTAEIDWERRHKHMRMHTCLHLVCAVIEAPVTGGQIWTDKGRLDFDLPETALDKVAIEARVNELIVQDVPTATRWITDEELAAQPELVRTMMVKPPTGQGRVRLLNIENIDLQPCGGTHVARTGEIGPIVVRKIENKGRHHRRIIVNFKEPAA